MIPRPVIRLFSGALLAFLALGCSDDEGPTGTEGPFLEVTPLFTGILEGSTVQLTATLAGEEVPVTWESNNTAAATVSSTGLVRGVGGGFAAITARMTSDPTKIRSSSITVTSPPTLTPGTPITGISSSGARFSTRLYKIIVPTGATSLTVNLSGGTGDVDLYINPGTPPDPATGEYACASFNGGNTEVCTEPNPTPGTWFILLELWDPYSGVTLSGSITP